MSLIKLSFPDVLESRLQTAKSLGADDTICVQGSDTDQDIVNKIVAVLGCEPTVSLDCTGAEQCVRVAIQVT